MRYICFFVFPRHTTVLLKQVYTRLNIIIESVPVYIIIRYIYIFIYHEKLSAKISPMIEAIFYHAL